MKGLLLAMLVAYAGWWLWHGPSKKRPMPGSPLPPNRPPPNSPPQNDAAALAVLGLPATASDDEIRAAHRRLLLTVHPDHGGSADLTRRVNAARDVLLKRPD